MAHEISEKFIEALHALEENRDLDGIAALFADDAECNNVVTIDNSHDLKPREFWQKYRDNFGEVRSEFKNKIYGENSSALEWTTTGTGADGGDVRYEGVSVLETDGDRITRFFAYFNPSKLGKQMEETARQKEA
ncbi:MAG TPA: nuclear transport factor 2 family protein [Pyrinomonadaceae bacterium]|jgi:ketosteroid isomerase-like protein